jgi:hypothetical protein
MRLLAWETGIVQFVIADSRRNDTPFIDRYSFIWQKLDFRLDGYLVYEIFGKAGTDFLLNRLQHFIILRKQLIAELKDLKNDPDFKNLTNTDPVPAHKLDIPLSLSRLLKFGADLWELPAASRELILSKTEQTLEKFLHS